jgi:Coenzyme PQQ synthesis protein D (PqqD)
MAETRPDGPIAEIDPQELSLESRVRVPGHVVYRAFVNETVALNLSTGTYHGLNPTAGRMLEAVNAADTLRDAARTLASDNAWELPTVQSDLTGLCRTLVESGLLEIVESESS